MERIRADPPRTAYQPEPVRREPTRVTEKEAPTSKTAVKRAQKDPEAVKATETAVKRAQTEALPLALTLALDLDQINRLFAAGQKEDNAEYRRLARNLCMLWSLGLGGPPVGLRPVDEEKPDGLWHVQVDGDPPSVVELVAAMPDGVANHTASVRAMVDHLPTDERDRILETIDPEVMAADICQWAATVGPPKGSKAATLLDWACDVLPRSVAREDRPDGIFGAALVQAPTGNRRNPDTAAGLMFQPFGHVRQQAGEQIYFPTFDPGEENGDPLSPALPLNLYDLSVGTLSASKQSKQRAAPLALRIFVEACLSVPQDKRRQGPVLLPRQTLREFLAGLYPNGHREWRKGKNLASLLGAIEALESSAARIPWQDETGRGGARRVVIPRDVPRSGHLDDYIQFAVDLPPGCERGPLIDRPLHIRAGALSAAKYRLALSLSFWWCKPGVLQVPVGRGAGRGLRWMQQTDKAKYPDVSDAVLVSMVYPGDTGREGGTHRKRLTRAKEALTWLVMEGFAAVAPKRRIYPGPKWAGWNYEPPALPS